MIKNVHLRLVAFLFNEDFSLSGNWNLHQMTANRRYALRIEVTSEDGRSKWGEWSNVEVGSPLEKYVTKKI